MSKGGQKERAPMRLGVSRTSACIGINTFLGVAERGAEEDNDGLLGRLGRREKCVCVGGEAKSTMEAFSTALSWASCSASRDASIPTTVVEPGNHVAQRSRGIQPVPVQRSSTWAGFCGEGVMVCARRRVQCSVSGRGIKTGGRVSMLR